MMRRMSMAALLASLLLSAGSVAASPLCDRLHARLADLPASVSNGAERPRDLSGAVSRQNIELRRARSDRRALGCSGGSIVVVNSGNEEACAALDARIDQLEEDIETLKARRMVHLAGSQDDEARRRVMVALQTNQCEEVDRDIVSASVEEPEGHRNIIADLPPIGTEELSLRGAADVPTIDLHGLSQEGPLRTVCVRTCDGSFFPISSNASPADFDRDEEACARRCPGAQTELYYHPLTQESDGMVSASTGRPYADLPTAFAYKTGDAETRSQCGCRLPQAAAQSRMSVPSGTSIVTLPSRENGTVAPAKAPLSATAPASSAPAAPVPQAEAAVIAAPAAVQTPAPTLAPTLARPAEERPFDPKVNRARQVGPTFLPAEESSIDLHHPAGPAFQPQQQTN